MLKSFGVSEIICKFAHETIERKMGTDLTGTQKQVFEKERTRREKLASFFYDLAKLMFAGTFIINVPGILSLDVETDAITNILFGLILTTTFAWNGNRILTY